MAKNFCFSDAQINILKNFAGINKSILIEPDKLSVISEAKSVIGKYDYDTPYDFDAFGLYDCDSFLAIHNAMTKPEIEVKDKFINFIGSNNDKARYFTTASELVPKVPDIESKCAKLDFELDFSLSSGHLAQLVSMSQVYKAKYIFFETDGKKINLTVGDALESSGNNYVVQIEDSIRSNKLDEPVKVALADFNILKGDYEVKVSKKITKWTNLNNVVYYITTDTKKQ
jgi:hypothetical protein